LYDQGFTISGARNKLQELAAQERGQRRDALSVPVLGAPTPPALTEGDIVVAAQVLAPSTGGTDVRTELLKIRDLLAI